MPFEEKPSRERVPTTDRGELLPTPVQDVPISTRKSLIERWYHLAAPKEPAKSTPEDRERVRAGRLSSIILVISFFFGVSQLPTAFASSNLPFRLIVLIAMAIDCVAFLLNRRGKVFEAGMIMVVVVQIGFILVVLTSRGLSARSLTIFHLLIVTELMAVSLLPPKTVFLTALCNALFTWAAITFMPHAPDFRMSSVASYYSALISPLFLQFIVAIVTYLWAQGAREAIARAERVAALERTLAERDRTAATEKELLEQGIQQILHIHVQAANGNFGVRAPVTQDNVLWQVAHGLNMLLARLQRATQSESELQRTEKDVGRFVSVVQSAKRQRSPLHLAKGGTMLDPLAQELTGTHIGQL